MEIFFDSSSMSRRRCITRARSSGAPGAGSPASRTTAFPAPETPSLSFTMTLSMAGRWARIDDTASARSSRLRRSSTPSGYERRPGEHPATAGLRSERREPRVGAVHRDAERERDVALELCGVVGDQMRAFRFGMIAAMRASSRGRSSSFSLSGRPACRAPHERQPGACVTGDHARQQRQVVLDDLRRDRHRRHVDHAQPGLAQEHQQEQEALLHRLGHAAAGADGAVEADRRNDHDRLVVVVESHASHTPGIRAWRRRTVGSGPPRTATESPSGPGRGGVHRSPVMTRSASCRRP